MSSSQAQVFCLPQNMLRRTHEELYHASSTHQPVRMACNLFQSSDILDLGNVHSLDHLYSLGATMKNTHPELTAYIENLGVAYQAQFVPMIQPQQTITYPQLHWAITLTKGGQTLATSYTQGQAHILKYKAFHKTPYDGRLAHEMYRKTCETGILYNHFSETFGWMRRSRGPKVQPPPSLLDILYCLVQDASVLDFASFEPWAQDCGYDADSRKAETIYKACVQQSLTLKNLIGSHALEHLQQLYQDY